MNIVVVLYLCVSVKYFGYWKLVWCRFSVWCSGRLLMLVGSSFRKVVRLVVLKWCVGVSC